MPQGDLLPVNPGHLSGPLELPHGFYLMPGSTGVGKSTTALALVLWLRSQGVPGVYKYVMEPRSSEVSTLMMPAQWEKFLTDSMEECPGGIIAIDSMTYNLSNMELATQRQLLMGNIAYKGGLTPRDVFSVLLLTALAHARQCVLIGTLNTELYPISELLEGASEGLLLPHGPGVFNIKDRSSGRASRPVAVPPEFVARAREILGVKPTRDADATGPDVSRLGVTV